MNDPLSVWTGVINVVCSAILISCFLASLTVFEEHDNESRKKPRRRRVMWAIGLLVQSAVSWGGFCINHYTTHLGWSYMPALLFAIAGAVLAVLVIVMVEVQRSRDWKNLPIYGR